ncbi:MAG: putative phage abortive infection protein [Aliarcobacter butzleri]|nr:putative phage abortive infection protein [Aliarcobacter butzleri]
MHSFKTRGYNYNYDKFNNNYEKFTGTYFGQAYQILKFINENNIENKQRYVNIFRAQFTKDELEFLFYHCLGSIGKRRFKKLVEDYEFFEHIILNKDIEKQLLEYDKKAFGKNEKILEKYNELKESKQ